MNHAGGPLIVFNLLNGALQFQATCSSCTTFCRHMDQGEPCRTWAWHCPLAPAWLSFPFACQVQVQLLHGMAEWQSFWLKTLIIGLSEAGIHVEDTSTRRISCQLNLIFGSQSRPSNNDPQTLIPQLRHFCSLLFHPGRMPFSTRYCSKRCVNNNKCNINRNPILMYSGYALTHNITIYYWHYNNRKMFTFTQLKNVWDLLLLFYKN